MPPTTRSALRKKDNVTTPPEQSPSTPPVPPTAKRALRKKKNVATPPEQLPSTSPIPPSKSALRKEENVASSGTRENMESVVTPPPSFSPPNKKKKSSTFKTPVNEKRKKQADVDAAARSMGAESFPDRLNWNNRYYGAPVTSTPNPAMHSLAVTTKDVDTCFGFDDPDEENYDSLISPINSAHRNKPLTFNALLTRYKHQEPDDRLVVHFEPPQKTYTHRKTHDALPTVLKRHNPEAEGHKKTTRKNNKANWDDDDLQKWVDEKNKEFDDVEHVPLLVKKSK